MFSRFAGAQLGFVESSLMKVLPIFSMGRSKVFLGGLGHALPENFEN